MSSLNQITLIGRLTRDVEVRTTNTGKDVSSFSIAVDRKFKRDGGPDADFFRCEAWSSAGEFAAKYLSKGRLICITGRMEQEKWADKDGNQREGYKVVAENVQGLDRPRDDQGGNPSQQATHRADEDDFDPFEGG